MLFVFLLSSLLGKHPFTILSMLEWLFFSILLRVELMFFLFSQRRKDFSSILSRVEWLFLSILSRVERMFFHSLQGGMAVPSLEGGINVFPFSWGWNKCFSILLRVEWVLFPFFWGWNGCSFHSLECGIAVPQQCWLIDELHSYDMDPQRFTSQLLVVDKFLSIRRH